jgi:hypothetical protein
MPWLALTRADAWRKARYPAPLEMIASFAAASCWCSISLAKAAVRMSELMAAEAFDP